jgi:BirA family transcriptional regulator, biotin operon repressor / biotin---[acetyl-CoA-carboxylase] ligase
MDQQLILKSLAGLPLGSVRYFDSIGSTNVEASLWLDQGAPDLALVIADEQTHGRGRAGRQWFTPPGSALAFSLVLRFAQVSQPGRLVARLTGLGSLAVSDALYLDYHLPVQIKWPNDVLINRRKVAGVLSEAFWLGEELNAVVLGIGVNVTPSAVPSARDQSYPATSVEGEVGRLVDRLELLKAILGHLLKRKLNLDSAQFLQDWEDRLAFRGEWVQIMEGGRVIDGQALRLNEDGSLMLLTREGQVISVHAGDLHLRPLQ